MSMPCRFQQLLGRYISTKGNLRIAKHTQLDLCSIERGQRQCRTDTVGCIQVAVKTHCAVCERHARTDLDREERVRREKKVHTCSQELWPARSRHGMSGEQKASGVCRANGRPSMYGFTQRASGCRRALRKVKEARCTIRALTKWLALSSGKNCRRQL